VQTQVLLERLPPAAHPQHDLVVPNHVGHNWFSFVLDLLRLPQFLFRSEVLGQVVLEQLGMHVEVGQVVRDEWGLVAVVHLNIYLSLCDCRQVLGRLLVDEGIQSRLLLFRIIHLYFLLSEWLREARTLEQFFDALSWFNWFSLRNPLDLDLWVLQRIYLQKRNESVPQLIQMLSRRTLFIIQQVLEGGLVCYFLVSFLLKSNSRQTLLQSLLLESYSGLFCLGASILAKRWVLVVFSYFYSGRVLLESEIVVCFHVCLFT